MVLDVANYRRGTEKTHTLIIANQSLHLPQKYCDNVPWDGMNFLSMKCTSYWSEDKTKQKRQTTINYAHVLVD